MNGERPGAERTGGEEPETERLWRVWDRVDPLLERALELPARERDAFAGTACEGDPELLDELRALLAAAEHDDQAHAAPGADLLEAAFPHEASLPRPGRGGDVPSGDMGAPALRVGDPVGPYRVLEEIGRGGMSTVYEAERDDGAFERRVAIKVLRRGVDTDDVVRRFLAERRILSSLIHPNIAVLLDGGSTEDGRPYLAMERVDGVPITMWVAGRGVPQRGRVELFLQVADAVSFAHRHLVIHRDLKPSNVLVDSDGRVKLLDFGIAKLLAGDPDATGLAAGLPMTPAYASPEQASGGAMTTTSDVYQLGALLCEILTGRRFTAEPGRGGVAAGTLRGDLGTIVEKATRREADARYASVDAFAEDLRAFLEGRPIAARPASAAYRLGKFLHRNPWLPAAAALLVLVTGGYLLSLGAQARRLEVERDRAQEAAARAHALRSFLLTQFGAADPYRADPGEAREATVVESLDRAAARARIELEQQPALLADILSDVSSVQANLDLRAPALAIVREAIELRRRAGMDLLPEQRDDLGRLAELLSRTGEPDSARAVAERRLTLEREAEPTDPARVASALSGLASVELSAGGTAAAAGLLRESVGLIRGSPADRAQLATTLEALADAERGMGDLATAERAVREALGIRRVIQAPDHPAVATAEVHLAQVLDAAGHREESVEVYRRALPALEASLGVEHFVTQRSWNNLANVLMELGDVESAEQIHRRLLAERRARLGPGPHPDIGASLQNLAATLVRRGRLDEADPLSVEASAIYRAVHGPSHPGVAVPLLTRAEIRLLRGDGPGAEALAAEALAILSAILPPGHYAAAAASCRVAAALALQGRGEEAEPMAVSALAALSRSASTPPRLLHECEETVASIGAPGTA